MFSATSLLVLACACAVTVNAQGGKKCTSAVIGELSNNPAPYAQGRAYDEVTEEYLENHPACVNGESGVYAWVCDNDVAPTVYFDDFNHLIIKRNGALNGSATVDVTAYCN